MIKTKVGYRYHEAIKFFFVFVPIFELNFLLMPVLIINKSLKNVQIFGEMNFTSKGRPKYFITQ